MVLRKTDITWGHMMTNLHHSYWVTSTRVVLPQVWHSQVFFGMARVANLVQLKCTAIAGIPHLFEVRVCKRHSGSMKSTKIESELKRIEKWWTSIGPQSFCKLECFWSNTPGIISDRSMFCRLTSFRRGSRRPRSNGVFATPCGTSSWPLTCPFSWCHPATKKGGWLMAVVDGLKSGCWYNDALIVILNHTGVGFVPSTVW